MLHVAPSSAAVDAVPAEPPAALGPAAARALVERQFAMLTRLAEIGMDVAEAAGRQAVLAGGTPAGTAGVEGLAGHPAHRDPGLTYVRVARAVRLTIALQSRLMKDLAALDRAQAHTRRTRIHRLVERAIEAEHDDADEIDSLCDDAWERLTEEEDGGDLASRPVGEIVARICKDLGLSPDWSAWACETGTGEAQTGKTGAGDIAAGGVGAASADAGGPWRPRPIPPAPDPDAPPYEPP